MDIRILGALGALCTLTNGAAAAIHLEFRAASPVYGIGNTVEFGLFAVSDSSGTQSLSAIEAIFEWDPGFLDLVGLDGTGGAGLAVADFVTTGSSGLNESNPPADGDGLFFGYASLGTPIDATPAGTLLTTFQFEALAETPGTALILVPAAGSPVRPTIVFDGVIPNTDVTGVLVGDTVMIVPAPGLGCAVLLAPLVARRRRR